MFLCDNCHDPDQHFCGRSYGICEGCAKKAACIDCHYSLCRPKRKKRLRRSK